LKKVICFLAIITLFASMFAITPQAATQITESQVDAKIARLKTLFPDESYFTTTGTNVCKTVTQSGSASWCSGGTSCKTCRLEYLFSANCTNNSIKTAIYEVSALNNMPKSRASCCGFATFAFCYIFEHDYLTNSTVISTANAGITDTFLSSLKPGDLIKCYTSMTSTEASHWAIFLGYDSNYVYLYESNNLRPNRVEYNNKRPRNGLKLKSDGSWVKLVAFRSNTHTSKLTVSDNYKVTAADGFLAIRSTNSTSGTKLGTIPTGATFTVTKYDNNGNWGYVTYNGVSGWCCLYDVERTSSSGSNTGSTTTPANDKWLIAAPDGSQALRTSYSTSSTKLCNIPNGQYVTVTQYASDGKWDWGHVTYNGQTGWVCLYYATKHTTHSYGAWTTAYSPTCTVGGTKRRTCACGAYEDAVIPATGHSYGAWTTIYNPTCAVGGTKRRTCACGAYEDAAISATGHSFSSTYTVDTAATCTTAGSKSRHCSKCSATTDVTAIPATGHSYGSWATVKNPACTTGGIKQRACACGATEKADIAALGHKFASTWTIDKNATCTMTGSKSHHCERCNAVKDITAVSATGHSYGEWVVEKEATVGQDGSEVRTCSSCSAQEKKTILALSEDKHVHEFGEWTTVKEATCNEKGEATRKCTECGAAETQEISMGVHKFGKWLIVKEATLTTDGEMQQECAECGTVQTQIIPALSDEEPPVESDPKGEITEDETDADASANDSASKEEEKGIPMLAIIVAAGVILIGGIVATIILISKKK